MRTAVKISRLIVGWICALIAFYYLTIPENPLRGLDLWIFVVYSLLAFVLVGLTWEDLLAPEKEDGET